MGDMALKCPLCCDRTFESKSELVDHLAILVHSLSCPICSSKRSSVADLIEHLTLDDCQPESTVPSISFDVSPESNDEKAEIVTIKQNLEEAQVIQIENDQQESLSNSLASTTNENIDDGSNMDQMYVEFLSKQLTKPCLQTKELKLVKDDGGISRYVFLTNENDDAGLDTGTAVVTKQNSDGTISLTTVKDMKMESEQNIAAGSQELDDSQEIYTCNTCGVSFTSVLDHIQNYHNDQDVVVEEPMEDMETGTNSLAIEFEDTLQSLTKDDTTISNKQHMPRRMITETGDIVEEPVMTINNKTIEIDPLSLEQSNTPIKKEKKVRNNSRQYVVVDSVVKEINQPNDKAGPYHKVVIKEILKPNGERMKIFNCMSCHIFVSSLNEFKLHPCKQLKYSCTHCQVSYDNSKSLCAHMKVHKSRGQELVSVPITYECEVCNTTFTNNKSLKLHKRMHDPIKSRLIEPPVEMADGTEVSMDKFLCSVCNKLIPIDYRAVHQNSHKGKSDFNCVICNKEFQSADYLEMHMNVHLNEKVSTTGSQDKSLPYTCLYCDRRFSRPHEKVKHERIHTGEKPHSCEICGKSFRVSYCLTLHMRTHTGARPYTCAHCGKRFKAHSVYNHHLMTHSEVRAYKCPYCPKAFKTSVQLSGHKNSHTKPFSCQHCNRPFASLYAVRVHTETHAKQNNLKFACGMCGASYARIFALKDHIKAVHNKDADKADIDKAINTMLRQKEGEQLSAIDCKEQWVMQNSADDNATEITIESNCFTQDSESKVINKVDWEAQTSAEDSAAESGRISKKIVQDVEMNEVAIVNSIITNELIVP